MPSSPTVPRVAHDEFGAFFRSHIRYVCESLRRLGVPAADVEDVAHEVFLAVYRRFDEYDPTKPPRPWLFAFALRLASGYRQRARVVRETIGLPAGRAAEDPNAEELLTQDSSRREVYAALLALPLERRVVFVMHELDERSVPDIAHELEIPVQTAYSRLHAARKGFVAEIRRRARKSISTRAANAAPRIAIVGGTHGGH